MSTNQPSSDPKQAPTQGTTASPQPHQSTVQAPASPSAEYMMLGELPESFVRGALMREFSPYSVALCRVREEKANTFTALGTGVLVKRGNRFGILTAHHCLHSCNPQVRLGMVGGDTLKLILHNGRGASVGSQEVTEHVLAAPQTEDFGPDLTFIELLALPLLASIKAIGSFWSLDRSPSDLLAAFGSKWTPLASIGFPEFDYNTEIIGNHIHHTVRHMTYANAIQEGDLLERDGWDYLESTMRYTGSDLPPSFTGVSGGPVWGMALKRHKSDSHMTIEKSALIGITFYQTARKNDERRLRAHFIKSIYDLAWRNLP